MADPIEIELKLEIDPADRARLAPAKLFAGASSATERLVATYFDTPRRDVRDAGYSLRVRREGTKRIQTVKTLDAAAGLFARGEWEREVDTDRPVLDTASGAPAPLLSAAAHVRLGRVFVTDVRRLAGMLDHDDARFECAIDDGEIRGGKRSLALCEIELELESGSPRSLFDFARRLDGDIPVRIAVLSKAERGYRLVDGIDDEPAKAEPVALDAGDSAGDAFRAIAYSCLRQFRINEAILAETGAVEALHQARVGLRRLRSAFSLYRPLFAGDRRTAFLAAELRWLAAELGELRNLDVLIAHADDGLHAQLAAPRDEILARVRAGLASARTRLLMINLAEWLALGDWCTHPGDPTLVEQDARRFADAVLKARRKRLRRYGKRLASLDDAHRHKVRIAAKKLRYAAQFFESLYTGEKARRRLKSFRATIEDLQDQLGDLNDLVVGSQILARLGIDAKVPGKDRAHLLPRAEKALEALVDAKPFWR